MNRPTARTSPQVLLSDSRISVDGRSALPPLVPHRAGKEGGEAQAVRLFRSACPHACEDVCALRTWVRNGMIEFVEGDLDVSFSGGCLCGGARAEVRRAYSPDRIKYPMLQEGRGSGKWRRIGWGEAVDRIARALLELQRRDGSPLGAGLAVPDACHGWDGFAARTLLSGLGPVTRFVGTAETRAVSMQAYDFGASRKHDPEDLVLSRRILIWGDDPATSSPGVMRVLERARRRGAAICVIDPVYTSTAARGDVYLKPRPGTDGALALGMARHLLERDRLDHAFLRKHTLGFEPFAAYLRDKVTVEWAEARCDVPAERIRAEAEAYATDVPAALCLGSGPGRGVRAIDALAAMTGNIGRAGGGVRCSWPEDAMAEGRGDGRERLVSLARADAVLRGRGDPPVRVLLAFRADVCGPALLASPLRRAMEEKGVLDLVAAADMFFNDTVGRADIVLPMTSIFEEHTLCASPRHRWLCANEQAVRPLHESRSTWDAARLLARRLNELEPGCCSFPADMEMVDAWKCRLQGQIAPENFAMTGKRPVKMQGPVPWSDGRFATASGRYEFWSEQAVRDGRPPLPVYSPDEGY